MAAAVKKRKSRTNVQSTDRGGALTLPLGVALVSFGFMMLLGALLQTASASLNFFKGMAIGLGGGMYRIVPALVIWLGVLLCLSAKRYVSMYPFLVTLLLFLAAGAMMTVTLRVNDKEYPSLMPYIRNLNFLRQSAYPDSMSEFLAASYRRYYGLFSENGFYPGGGAMGMLLAWPLYMSLGSAGAIAVLVLMLIALLFALLRQSPARLVQRISDRVNRRPVKVQPVPEPVNAAQQKPDVPPVYPEDDFGLEPYQPQQPAWPAAEAVPAYQPVKGSQPGFVAQPASTILEEPPLQAGASAYPPAEFRHHESVYAKPAQPRGAVPERDIQSADEQKVQAQPLYNLQTQARQSPEPRAESAQATKEESGAVRRAGRGAAAAKTDEPAPEAVQPVPAAAAAAAVEPPETMPPGHAAKQDEAPARAVNVQPAVALSGEKVSIARREEPVIRDSLDGMVRKPAVKQIKLVLDDYETPPVRLLTEPPESDTADTTVEDLARAEKLIETLKSFSIPAHLHDITHGPTVTRFAIRLAEGVNVSRLRSVMDNLTIELKAKGDIRAEMPIPGTSFVGLEVSNDKTSKVYLREVLSSVRMQESRSPTAVALGKDITGTPIVCELMDMPHLLIAGATGSGKSVCINSIICSMLYRASPRHVRMIMIDPKFVELQPYNDVPHLMMPVITDAKKAAAALDWVCQEMDERYQILVEAGVRNLDAYNRKLGPDEEPIPRVIVIVDEMADLMTTSGKMVEDHIKRITAKARAAGICLILATQRPSVNIITGVIKANIPGRIAFRVSSPFDSKTILDGQGAEKLLGYGDMLYRSTTREPIRIQGCFVSDKDVEQTVEYIRSRNKAEYNLDLIEHIEKADQPEGGGSSESSEGGDGEFDELLPQAIEMAVEAGQMSISMLQRVLRVGYARSGRLIDEMTRRGIISGNEGTKPRKTLMTREQYLAYLEQSV